MSQPLSWGANLHAGKWILKWTLQFWSLWSHQELGHNTQRLWAQAVLISFVLLGGHGDGVELHHVVLLMWGGIYWKSIIPYNQGQEIIISYFPQNAFKLHPAYSVEVVTPSRKAFEIFDPKKPRRNLFVCFLFTYITVMTLDFCPYSSLRSKWQNPEYSIWLANGLYCYHSEICPVL